MKIIYPSVIVLENISKKNLFLYKRRTEVFESIKLHHVRPFDQTLHIVPVHERLAWVNVVQNQVHRTGR